MKTMLKTDFYREISANKWRSFALMFVFALVVLGLGYVLGLAWGNPYFGFTLAFIVSLVMAWVSYYWSDSIVLAISRAQPADEHEFAQLHNVVEEMALAAGLPKPRVYVIDDPAPNAFATGRDPQHSVICATTGLLRLVNRNELQGVIAHEMSHVRNYDVRFQTIAVVLAGVIILMSDWLLRSMFFGRRRGRDSRGANPAMLIILVIGIVFAILSPFIAQLLKMAISRRREYLADASAVELTRYPDGLADALTKLARNGRPMQDANRATAHLFIVTPLRESGFDRLFSTHPPIEDRIARLRAMDLGDAHEPLQSR